MKLGLLTAAFPDTPLTEVADWAAGNGFSALEVACWPAGDGAARRYAGVSHIDVAGLSDAQAKELAGDLAGRGIEISGLGSTSWKTLRKSANTSRPMPIPFQS